MLPSVSTGAWVPWAVRCRSWKCHRRDRAQIWVGVSGRSHGGGSTGCHRCPREGLAENPSENPRSTQTWRGNRQGSPGWPHPPRPRDLSSLTSLEAGHQLVFLATKKVREVGGSVYETTRGASSWTTRGCDWPWPMATLPWSRFFRGHISSIGFSFPLHTGPFLLFLSLVSCSLKFPQ